MRVKRSLYPLLLLFLVLHLQGHGQKRTSLPRSTPEAEGVSSQAISTFLDSVAKSRHEFHSFMLLRHGNVIAEGWWKPYRADLKHTLYSLSKSFAATAIGFARAEGKLSLTDKVVSFFPDELPDTLSSNLQQLTVKDLLTMSVGQEPDPTSVVVQDSNWVRGFLSLPIKLQPGTRFLYNSMATYMLSAIVQKVTGQMILDFLQSRLFDPLDIARPDWESDPKGINTGGWGLRLKTEDIAKFAQLFLQKGKWNGKQVLPAGWVEEASMAHIIQHPEYSQAKRDSSDWEQGYGYQMWRCRNNAYRGDGAFGQYAIVLPGQDAVIAITSETPDMQGELNLIWKILLPAMKNGKLSANKNADAALKQKLNSLSLPVKKEQITPSLFAKIAGKKWVIEPNTLHIQSMELGYKNNSCQLWVKTDTASYSFSFGANAWQNAETTLPGPYLVNAARNSLKSLPPFKVAGEYTWLDAATLELVLRYIESPHTETWLFRFDGTKFLVDMKRSFNSNLPGATVTLSGSMK
jgi:CubicO group peptidase (beta-lactamase class C family)